MIVKCKLTTGKDIGKLYRLSGETDAAQYDLKIGKLYYVHGFAIYENVPLYLVRDECHLPNWYSVSCFEIIDGHVDSDWYCCGLTSDTKSPLQLLMGYKELAQNKLHGEGLLERMPEALQLFNARADHYEALL